MASSVSAPLRVGMTMLYRGEAKDLLAEVAYARDDVSQSNRDGLEPS